jgi:hypothetical protein
MTERLDNQLMKLATLWQRTSANLASPPPQLRRNIPMSDVLIALFGMWSSTDKATPRTRSTWPVVSATPKFSGSGTTTKSDSEPDWNFFATEPSPRQGRPPA